MKKFKSPFKRNLIVAGILFIVVLFIVIDLTMYVGVENTSPIQEIRKKSSSEPSLTLWTILRDLPESIDKVEQMDLTTWLGIFHTENALKAWLKLTDVDLIFFGDSKSCAFVSSFLPLSNNWKCLPIPCFHPTYGIPQYDCLFQNASALAKTEFVGYINSDIVVFDDLLESLRFVSKKFDDFILVGRRQDLNYPKRINFADPNWEADFKDEAKKYGERHGKYGLDYFIYRKKYTRQMPPFLVGRIRWDNWLLTQFIGNKDSVAIDASETVFAVHINHMNVGGSHNRVGTDWNKKLSEESSFVDPKKIGDLESTDYILSPQDPENPTCPKCELKKRMQSLDVMLYKMNVDKKVMIATVDAGYLDFALNWACSLERVGLRNYIFHATDMQIYNELQARGQPTIFYLSKMSEDYINSGKADSVVYGSVSYQSIMNTRTELIYKALQKGYDILLCDVDIVLLRNPFLFFDPLVDIQGGAHKQTKLTGGFIFFRSTKPTLSLWYKVLYQHREIFTKIQGLETFDIHSMTEQELLNNALAAATPGSIAWKTIPETVLADGKRFYIDKLTQKNGEWPAGIHNNYIIGADSKRERFQNVSLWYLDEKMHCTSPSYLPPCPTTQGYNSPAFVIKVITYNRPKSLTALLKSLYHAKYPDNPHIKIEIIIDYLSDTATEEDKNDRLNVIKVAKSFNWKLGPKKIIERTENYGLANQWLKSWFPANQSEIAFFLEDDNIVSPHYYIWLKKMVMKYYFNPEQYDPRVYGISLQFQHMIPGKYPTRPYTLLSPQTYYFKYQQVSTWGPVFFPSHWADFLMWYEKKSSDLSFDPLFSNLITNQWYLKRGNRAVWSVWFMRYAAEKGVYSIYTNFPSQEALVVNSRAKGVNYHEDQGANSNMLLTLKDEIMDFPDSQSMPIYDFHFNQVTEDPRILENRGVYSDTFNVQTH